MLYQLPAGEFHRAWQLFGGEQHHLAVISALAGETPAELYVDNPNDPRAGLLILWNDRLYLAGEPNDATFCDEFATLLRERFTPRAAEGESYDRNIAYMPPTWEARLPSLFATITSFRVERESYCLQVPTTIAIPPLTTGLRLRQVDAALVADSALGNHSDLLDEMQSEAPSVAEFLAGRFGCCVQRDAELVAWCLSEYNHGNRCELGIATLPAFQRRGLATAVALAVIAHAQSQGITIVGWHCWKENLSSGNLARKLGFSKVEDYPVWHCRFGQLTAT